MVVKNLNRLLICTLPDRCDTELYMLKLHLQKHEDDAPERLEGLQVLDVSSFEIPNLYVKLSHRTRSQSRNAGYGKGSWSHRYQSGEMS